MQTRVIGALEAAEILNIDPATVTRWAKDGKLPHQKLRGQTGAYVFDLAEVEKLRDKLAAEAVS